MTIRPSADIQRFEIFFASYIAEIFDETWVPIVNAEGDRAWTRLNNRAVINRTFGVARNDLSREMIQDGRYGEPERGLHRDLEESDFSLPILAARNSLNGFTLVFLCDPAHTTYLTGQYHRLGHRARLVLWCGPDGGRGDGDAHENGLSVFSGCTGPWRADR